MVSKTILEYRIMGEYFHYDTHYTTRHQLKRGFMDQSFLKWRFAIFQLGIGNAFAPAIRLKRISPRSAIAQALSKECLSRVALLRLMIKLGLCAEESLQKLRDFNYLSGVTADIEFTDRIETTINNQAAT